MSVKIGDTGGIGVAPETTYGAADAPSRVWQHAISASIGLRKSLITPRTLGTSPFSTRRYTVPYVDGEIVVGYNASRAVIGNLLNGCGNLSTDTYTIGDGSAPDSNSQTIWVDYGGIMMQYAGAKIQSLKLDIQPDQEVAATFGFLAQAATQQSSTAISAPSESGLVMESDLTGSVTMGGATVGLISATIEANPPLDGSGRHFIGGTTIREPQRIGRSEIKATLNMELSDEASNNTISQFADYVSGTAIGDVVIDNFILTGCYATGEPPSLEPGVSKLTMNVIGETLTILTTA